MLDVLAMKLGDVVPTVSWKGHRSNLSPFDNKLLMSWNDAVKKGFFRYELNIQGSQVIPGKFKFFAELNPERGENRRKPQEFYSVNDPFNPALFNFTKIKKEEVMFELKLADNLQDPVNRDLLAINVSPISEGHSLIIPQVNRMLPQALTQFSIELGLHLLLISATPSFRIAFNSLCGYASVNHLHLHGLYVDHSMILEALPLIPLEGPCFHLNNYPGKGFAFQSLAKSEASIKILARNVFKLTSFLHRQNEAHNVLMTRAKMTGDDEVLSGVRVYVWVRTPNAGAKETTGFNPAALELSGYFVLKNVNAFETISETVLCDILEKITSEPFERNYKLVQKLFQADPEDS